MNMVMRWQRTRRLCLSEVVFMREILFKAKRIDNGAWVEGYVFDDGFADSKRLFVGGLVIMDYKGTADDRWNVGTAFYEVIPDTICQYTGLTDKNGRKIWEGDVVRCMDTIGKVGWNETHLAYTILADMKGNMQYFYLDESLSNCTEVIGNIFDNADLLGE